MLHAADYHTAANEIEIAKDHYNVLVTHGLATTIQDKRLSTVAEFELDQEILSDKFDYIALGHYHGQKQVGPNAWYSGSQEHLTYGEIADVKGALHVDLGKTRSQDFIETFELPKTRMDDFGIIECADRPLEEIARAIYDLAWYEGQIGQVTLDFGDNPVRNIPLEYLAGLREEVLDLKIRVRSNELKQAVMQQDLHTVNYVEAWDRFMGPEYPLNEKQRELVAQLGRTALQSVIAEHSEAAE